MGDSIVQGVIGIIIAGGLAYAVFPPRTSGRIMWWLRIIVFVWLILAVVGGAARMIFTLQPSPRPVNCTRDEIIHNKCDFNR